MSFRSLRRTMTLGYQSDLVQIAQVVLGKEKLYVVAVGSWIAT